MTSLPPADLIIENVKVITMDTAQPYALGVAIADGKFIGLISKNNEKWPLSPNGLSINGAGMTLMPGLIDAHCHLLAQISQNISVSCRREHISSINEIISTIRNRAKQIPVGTWIRAGGYDAFYLKEKRHPTRWDLDKATTEHPIRLRHITRHVSVLNSMALKLAKIGLNKSEPSGVIVEREAETSIPTGRIYGGDAWLSETIIPPISMAELTAGAEHLENMLLSLGITALQDATPTNNTTDVEFWYSCIKNKWPISILLMADRSKHPQLTEIIKNKLPQHHQHKLQIGPVKVAMEAYPQLYPDLEELKKIAAEATSRNFPIAIHAVTPEMAWAAVEAIKYAAALYPKATVRHRIEHLSLCPDSFLNDIAESQAIVVTNPIFIHDHGDRYLSNISQGEYPLLYRMNSLYTRGIPIAAGSDAPVASFNPWVGVMTACSRKTSAGNTIADHEKLNRWQALELYTTSAALAAGWENCRGSIKPRRKADFILLDKNPIICPLEELDQIQVVETWIDGKLAYYLE